MREIKQISLVGLFVLFQFFCHITAAEAQPVVKAEILDQTDIRTIDGKTIHVELTKKGLRFKGYENKIVLLEAFGYRCPPCKASIPGYNRLQKKYQKDIIIIGVEAWGADNATFKGFVQKHKIQYKAVSTGDSGKILLFMKRLTGWHPGIGVPYLMLFDHGGVLSKDVSPQILPEAHVEHLIRELLKRR
jgi:thiol-disulfide isomerase/thioredoxin